MGGGEYDAKPIYLFSPPTLHVFTTEKPQPPPLFKNGLLGSLGREKTCPKPKCERYERSKDYMIGLWEATRMLETRDW